VVSKDVLSNKQDEIESRQGLYYFIQ